MRLTPDIVTAIQELALVQRSLLGVRAQWHVGDLAWNLSPHQGRELDMRFWDEDGRLVAWSWVQHEHDGRLEYDVHPDRLHLLDEILATADARSAFAFADDDERRAALGRHGLTQPGDAMHYFARDLAEPPSPAPLPDGFRARTVSTGDVPERVAIHQDVWAPSRLTESSYAQVRAQWPYRGSLDCVVEAPDGRFAAYCLCWLDDAHHVGELEPVGVRAEFRRRGRAPPSARSRSGACTRRVGGRRSSTAPPSPRARSTNRSASAATPRSSATHGSDRKIGA